MEYKIYEEDLIGLTYPEALSLLASNIHQGYYLRTTPFVQSLVEFLEVKFNFKVMKD